MEREVDCQTDSVDISEEIKISEKVNDILVSYAKNLILNNPSKSFENENIIKKRIYEWSREYFQKLYDENGKDNKILKDDRTELETSVSHVDCPTVKDQIKKEMERVNFNMDN
ncbi:hypothetical protein, conserved [Plasmodium gonderi]|uniref:Uncharacterized protein n=1 Tax=Plasmodium gonderi TaxID=77519 RepID=A0A1Y1JGW3_PLAGO|nr:hypothetical protein, conserved [Plasmodium gonderi]GAW81761.1 hypothetical protein, conserved [Plasmodium gonderi]